MNGNGYLVTNDSVQVVYEGRARTIPRTAPQAAKVLAALKARDIKAAYDAADLATQLARKTEYGEIRILDNEVQIRTTETQGWERLPPVLEARILDIFKQGLPLDALLAFAARLWKNPSRNSREQLYKFLEHQGMPITEKGTFLAYKGVKADLYDVHSGKFLNAPGTLLRMERRNVDDNPERGCSYGFHVGSHEYASHWGVRCMLVEVDPANVVSVPNDCNWQKCRTTEYLVLSECEGILRNGVVDPEDPYSPVDALDESADALDDTCEVHCLCLH